MPALHISPEEVGAFASPAALRAHYAASRARIAAREAVYGRPDPETSAPRPKPVVVQFQERPEASSLPQARRPALRRVLAEVAAQYGVRATEVASPLFIPSLRAPRLVYMQVAARVLGHPLRDVGRAVARTEATVLDGLVDFRRQMEDEGPMSPLAQAACAVCDRLGV